MEYILLGFVAAVLLFAVRNELIHSYYKRAMILDPSILPIGYDRLIYDLRKWTFHQCFPKLGDRV